MAQGDLLLIYSGANSYTEALSTGGVISSSVPLYFPSHELDAGGATGAWPVAGLEIVDIHIPENTTLNLSNPLNVTVYVYTVDNVTAYYYLQVVLSGAETYYYHIEIEVPPGSPSTPIRGVAHDYYSELGVNNLAIMYDLTPANLLPGTYNSTITFSKSSDGNPYAIGTGRYLSSQQPARPIGSRLPATNSIVYGGAVSLVCAQGLYDEASTVAVTNLLNQYSARVRVVIEGAGYRVYLQCRSPSAELQTEVNFYVGGGTGTHYLPNVWPNKQAAMVVSVNTDLLDSTVFSRFSSTDEIPYAQYFFVAPDDDRILPSIYEGGGNAFRGYYVLNMSKTQTYDAKILGVTSTVDETLQLVRDATLLAGSANRGTLGNGTTTGVLTSAIGPNGEDLNASYAVFQPIALNTLSPGQCSGFWLRVGEPPGYSGGEALVSSNFAILGV